jgi:hypothetical protein
LSSCALPIPARSARRIEMPRRRKASGFREQDVGGPPADDAWLWHSAALIFSPAWRGRSVPLIRLLDLLEEQLLRGGRHNNGSLMAQYVDMVKRGISRGSIPAVIAEGVARGLLEVRQADPWPRPQGTKQAPNLFRLTYLPNCTQERTGVLEWHKQTDEWRCYVEPPKRPKRSFRRTRESTKARIPSTESGTKLVPNSVLGQNGKVRKMAKIRVPDSVPAAGTGLGTVYTIYSEEGNGGPNPSLNCGAVASPDTWPDERGEASKKKC